MARILVIEDEQTVRESIQDLLELEGFQTLGAPNGEKGLQLAQEKLPDLILCDVQMPDMNGYDVFASLNHNPSTNTIPFIFLTARSTRADRRYGMELGADDYLTKPCTAKELLGAVVSRLNKSSAVETRIQEELTSLRQSIALSLPHELRTPITSILSSTELLRVLAPTITEARILEVSDDIEEAVQRLYRLVQNYLLYAQLELMARDPERLKVVRSEMTNDCAVVIMDAATVLAQRAERLADLTLNLEKASVAMAYAQLQKVITELVDNALKFSSSGSPITVESFVEGQQLILEVGDRGRGMTANQIALIGAYFQFDRHYYEQQGLGLGLAIARRILELHGGSLQIDSQINEGTKIRASLPMSEHGSSSG